MVASALAALHTAGRAVELSKREIWSAARVAQERPDVSFCTLAVDFMSEEALGSGLLRIARQLAQGELLRIAAGL